MIPVTDAKSARSLPRVPSMDTAKNVTILVAIVHNRPRLAALPPARRIDVLDRLLAHVIASLLDGRCDRIAHSLLGFAERAERELDVEDVTEPADCAPAAHMVDAGHQPDQGQQARAEDPRARPGGQLAARHLAAVARDAVLAECDHVGRDHGDFDHLMAQRIGIGLPGHNRRPHRRQLLGKHSLVPVNFSAGSTSRFQPLCPGCPPRLRPEGPFFGRSRRSSGASVDGGKFEFNEFCPSRASSVSILASNFATKARSSAFSASSFAIRASRSSITHTVDHTAIHESIPNSEVIEMIQLLGAETFSDP